MSLHILDAMARESFEEVLAIHDRDSGLRAFLGVHDTRRGPAFGGIRRWRYANERQALIDCLRLAQAMTHKCALVGVPGGGAKLVVLDRGDLDRAAAYRHLGRVVERRAGRFYTGPDVGTGERELGWVAEETSFVTRPGKDGPGELAEATAEGVFAGIGAALRALDGEEDWPRRTIVIQGLGGVGFGVARRCAERGARVLGTEIDPVRARRAARTLGVELITPGTEFDVACDVFSPCALGGILHDLTVQRLGARSIAGGANNQLARSVHAERLHERGVLFVPDLAINGGALIRGVTFHLEGRREPLDAIGSRIAAITERILERARAENRSPARVALLEATRALGASDGEPEPAVVHGHFE